MRKVFTVSILLFVLGFHFASAQTQIQEMINPRMSIELQPPYPQPGERVTASLSDYGGGTYGSTVTWLLNGEEIPEAQNRRSAEITAGKVGENDTLQVILTRSNGSAEYLTAVVRPIYIDIIFEPQTRVPDFYLGRSLPSIGAVVNATALVNTGSFEEDLVYTWRLNRQVLESGPIRGRNKVSFEMPMGNRATLSLQVTHPNGMVLGNRAIYLPSVQPQLKFYEVNALLGMNDSPIKGTFQIIGNTTSFRAEPYNLDSRVYNNPDISVWEINGQEASTGGGNPYEVTLQRTGTQGNVRLNFHVRDTTQVLQGAEDTIRIAF